MLLQRSAAESHSYSTMHHGNPHKAFNVAVVVVAAAAEGAAGGEAG